MLEMNLQRFSHQDPTPSTPPIIPSGLPEKPGPKLVSTKGNVERLVVVLENDDNLKAATKRVLKDGNHPAIVVNDTLMTWSFNCYIGFGLDLGTGLGVAVGTFNDQGKLNVAAYVATITKKTDG